MKLNGKDHRIAASPRRPSAFGALWTATGAANLADGLALFALPLLAVDLDASAAAVAGVTTAITAGWLVFGFAAGMIVDRVDRRRLLLGVTGGRALVLGALFLATATGRLSVTWILVAAFTLGVGETLVDTGLTAMVPAVARNDLGRANARIEATQNIANQFVGPPLAGMLAATGLAWTVAGAAGGYLVALLALSVMAGRYRPLVGTGGEAATWRRAFAGLAVLWRSRPLRVLTILTAAMNLCWAAWTAVFVLYAVAPGPMQLSRPAYGALLTAMAVGGVAGSLLVEPARRRLGPRPVLALDVLGTFLLVAAPAVSTSVWLIAPAMVVAGAGSAVWRVLVNSLRQSLVPDDLLGRVYASSRLVSWGVLPVGAALGGVIAQVSTVRTVFAVWTAVSAILVVGFRRWIRAGDVAAAG